VLSFQSYFGAHWIIPVLALAVALGLAWWFYRHSRPLLGRLPCGVAMSCRIAALFLLLLALVDGQFQIKKIHFEKPRLALLIDRSASMAAPHHQQRRIDAVFSQLASPEFQAFARQHTLIPYGFSDSLQSTAWGDSALAAGEATNLARSLRGLNRHHPHGALMGALVLSDGRLNRGGDACEAAAQLGCPVWTCVAGDTAQPPDVMIASVLAPDAVWLDQPAKVKIRIRNTGTAGGLRRLKLLQGESVLKDTLVALPSDGFEHELTVSVRPQRAGLMRWTVGIDAAEGESNTSNNSRRMAVRVRRARPTVLVLASAPGADLAAFRRRIGAEKRHRLVVRIEKTNTQFYQGPLPDPVLLDSLAGVLLWDYPTATSASWPRIQARLSRGDLPFGVVAGARLDPRRLHGLHLHWPWPSLSFRPVEATQPGVNHRRRHHPLFLEGGRTDDFFAHGLPPVQRRWSIQDSTALILSADGDALLALSTHLPARRCLLVGETFFKWDLHSAALYGRPLSFWGRLADWLTDDSAGRGQLTADRDHILAGESVSFEIRLDDVTGRPMTQRLPLLAVQSPGGRSHHAMRSTHPGVYRSTVDGLAPGLHRATVTGGGVDSPDTLLLWVAPFPAESLDQRADPESLARIAAVTGGESVVLDSLPGLVRRLSLQPEPAIRWHRILLRNQFWTYWVIVFFLGVEWWLRRRSGLL